MLGSKALLESVVKQSFLPLVGRMADHQAMLDNESMREAIRTAIERSGHTKAYIAERVGVTEQAITGWLKTGRIDKRRLPKLAQVTGTPLQVFMPDAPGHIDDPDGWSDVRGVLQAAALGDGSFPDEYAETHKLRFRASSLRRKGLREQNLVVFYGDGDSMLPRIHHGDALLFDTSDKRPVDGQIYLFSSPDTGLTVKRLVDYGGRWFVEADNKAVANWTKPVPMDGRHPYTIEGRLRWIGSWEG